MVDSLYNIWMDDDYAYCATSSGLDVVELDTEVSYAFAENDVGYTAVWASSTNVYLGTSNSGIRYLSKSNIFNGDITNEVFEYRTYPDITNNNVKYLHGNNNNNMICCTISGVDIIRISTSSGTSTLVAGAEKCFATPDHDYYYYTVSGTNYSINKLSNNTEDWTVPNVSYTTASGFLSNASSIKDFFVTEHTSVTSNKNTLFVATDNGIYVYDEGLDLYELYDITT